MKCPRCGFHLQLPTVSLGGGEMVGDFRIEELLGVGGMGEVFRATQMSMKRAVAVKILPPAAARKPEDSQRFIQEARTLARIQHPNIVEAIDAGEDRGRLYFAMSFVDGETLEHLLTERKIFDEQDALRICLTVAQALENIWTRHHLLHRDIKPANIMLDRQGRVKLMDLGISRYMEDKNATLATAGTVHGTPEYISPEQARGEIDLDHRADIYSLGATLYHLVTGVLPFKRKSVIDLLLAHIKDPLPDPTEQNPHLSAPCSLLLQWMMKKDRTDRPADWGTVIQAMEEVIRGKMPAVPGGEPQNSQSDKKKGATAGKSKRKKKKSPKRVSISRPPVVHQAATGGTSFPMIFFLLVILGAVIAIGLAKSQGVDILAFLFP